jgi:uncharacterized protein YjeT (DUF2065 family)
MNNLLSLKFWFNLRPGALLPIYQKALIVFIIILGILIFIFTILVKQDKKSLYNHVCRNLRSFGLANIIIGLLILFFTYEMVPFLSARFWFLFWGAEIVVWLIFILRMLLEIPKKKEQMEKEKEFNKYIP